MDAQQKLDNGTKLSVVSCKGEVIKNLDARERERVPQRGELHVSGSLPVGCQAEGTGSEDQNVYKTEDEVKIYKEMGLVYKDVQQLVNFQDAAICALGNMTMAVTGRLGMHMTLRREAYIKGMEFNFPKEVILHLWSLPLHRELFPHDKVDKAVAGIEKKDEKMMLF